MNPVLNLLRENRNYRWIWCGQVVSDIGYYFNNIAVFSLVVQTTGSGLALTAVMLARGVPAMMAGPIAGVLLDRWDRRRVMMASDLVRSLIALSFVLALEPGRQWLVLPLSALLMFAMPFFTSGRAALLPTIAGRENVHIANSVTQVTEWTTQTVGTLAGGFAAAAFGYKWAFVLNAFSFLFSALAASRLRSPRGHFRAERSREAAVQHPAWEYVDGLRYIRSQPLVFGIAMLTVGWASGGGAAQILFTLFGEVVFQRGSRGIGSVWGFAGLGLLAGGLLAHRIGQHLSFKSYKRTITVAYLAHGIFYIAFSQASAYALALFFIALSRAGQAVCSVLNYSKLMRYTEDQFRGRVFSTLETLRWSVMMLSMGAAGVASHYYGPREIAAVAGALGGLTGLFWLWADARGKLPEPRTDTHRASQECPL
jgi:MFS family permease